MPLAVDGFPLDVLIACAQSATLTTASPIRSHSEWHMGKNFDLQGSLKLSGKDGGLTVRELVFENAFAADEQPVALRLNAVDESTGDLIGVALCVRTAFAGRSPDEIMAHIKAHGDIEVHEVRVVVKQAWLRQLIGRVEITLTDRSVASQRLHGAQQPSAVAQSHEPPG